MKKQFAYIHVNEHYKLQDLVNDFFNAQGARWRIVSVTAVMLSTPPRTIEYTAWLEFEG